LRTVLIANPKGGSGKTTLATNLAGYFATRGRRVVLSDLDRQQSSLAWLRRRPAKLPLIQGVNGRRESDADPGAEWTIIDSPAGPSEVLVLADGTAAPGLVAREVLAQAEHDPDAACVVVVAADGESGAAEDGDDDSTHAGALAAADALAAAIRTAIEVQLSEAPRRAVAAAALAANGAVLVAANLDEAVAFTRAWAPEHLSVMTAAAAVVASRIKTAGTTFVGPFASVAFGDYLTGANHVLPTGGRARSFSGLSVHHYLRSYTVQEITARGAAALADDVALLADAEGLPAHGAAALARRGT